MFMERQVEKYFYLREGHVHISSHHPCRGRGSLNLTNSGVERNINRKKLQSIFLLITLIYHHGVIVDARARLPNFIELIQLTKM